MLERGGVPLWKQAVKCEPSWRETRATFTSPLLCKLPPRWAPGWVLGSPSHVRGGCVCVLEWKETDNPAEADQGNSHNQLLQSHRAVSLAHSVWTEVSMKEDKNSGRINKELLQVGLQRPCCSLLVLSTAGLMQRFFLKTLRRGGEGFSTETLQTLCRPSCLYNTPILALEVFLKDKANGEIDKNKSLRGGKQWENRLFLLVTLPASAFTGVSELSLSLSSSMH